MAPRQLYPRSVLKRILKAHTGAAISKNVDVLVYLDYTLFLQELLREAGIEAQKAGDKSLSARHVRRVTEATVRKFKG